MRHLLLLIAIEVTFVAAARAQAPAYQRTRGGAGDWQARGGHAQHWRGPGWGYGGFYDPFFVAAPIIAGSYYQRPYPYHLDYYRYRWGAPESAEGAPPSYPTSDCPCAAPLPLEATE